MLEGFKRQAGRLPLPTPPSCLAGGFQVEERPTALATGCLHRLFAGSTCPWLPLETIPAWPWSPLSRQHRVWNPPVELERKERPWNESRPGCPPPSQLGRAVAFHTSNWLSQVADGLLMTWIPGSSVSGVEFGIYSGKAKVAGGEKKRQSYESQVLCAEAPAKGLS